MSTNNEAGPDRAKEGSTTATTVKPSIVLPSLPKPALISAALTITNNAPTIVTTTSTTAISKPTEMSKITTTSSMTISTTTTSVSTTPPVTTTETAATTTVTTAPLTTADSKMIETESRSCELPERTLMDNGIFDFMTVDKAIELYNKIHSSGIPDLDWKFYGRRKPDEPKESDEHKEDKETEEQADSKETNAKEVTNTEFDFDEDFGDLSTDTSTINQSLQLKKRIEPGSEKKTNLSDIMSDIRRETSHTEKD